MFKWIKWAIFSNDDDGIYGPDDHKYISKYYKDWYRVIRWWVRNPAHNFTHYVIGIKGKEFITYSWDSLELHFSFKKYKWLWLPYFKYYGKFSFYIGWRSSGAFGVSIRRV